MNRRIIKTAGGTTTVFLYDIYNNLIGEYDGSTGNTNKEYIYLGSKALAMITEPTTPISLPGCSYSTALTTNPPSSPFAKLTVGHFFAEQGSY